MPIISFELVRYDELPACRRCGAGPALVTDPDGLCPDCLLSSLGIPWSDDETWAVRREAGRVHGEQWRNYFLDYAERRVDDEPRDCLFVVREGAGDPRYPEKITWGARWEVWAMRIFPAVWTFGHRYERRHSAYLEVQWDATFGAVRMALRGLEGRPTARDIASAYRGLAIFDRAKRAGRKPLTEEDWSDWREHADAASALKRRQPTLTWAHVAARRGVPESTLRRWVSLRAVERSTSLE